MKSIIKGKKYDTETAKLCGKWSNGLRPDDFGYRFERLYQKKNGEFFLHGEGGAQSCYSRYIGGCLYGDEKIIPKTYSDARQWAEEHLSADEYEAIFGEVTDDDTSTVLAVRLPASTAEKVKRAAYEAGITISAYVDSKLNS